MSRYDPESALFSPQRLRNLRVLHEELGLVLEELSEMDEEERTDARSHERHAERLLTRMRTELGAVGTTREDVEERMHSTIMDMRPKLRRDR